MKWNALWTKEEVHLDMIPIINLIHVGSGNGSSNRSGGGDIGKNKCALKNLAGTD